MGPGSKAFASGCLTFVVATSIVIAISDGGEDPLDAVTIGGLTGGAVAFPVWQTEGRSLHIPGLPIVATPFLARGCRRGIPTATAY